MTANSRRSSSWSLPLLLLLLLPPVPIAACSDSGGGGDADTTTPSDGRDTSPPSGRSFLIGGRAEAYDLTHPNRWIASTDALGTGLAEVVVIPLDTLGIPWASFTGPDNRPTTLPGPWLQQVMAMEALATATDLPVVLSLSPLRRQRDGLAAEASEQAGALNLNDTWRPTCYDPSKDGSPTKWRDAYAGFAVWAVDRFDPDWVIVGAQLNLYEGCAATAYDAIKDYAAEAHRRIQGLDSPPTTIVSVDVEDLYGYPRKPGRCAGDTPAACFDKRKGLLSGLTADVLGLHSQPGRALPELGGPIPADWLTRIADAAPDMTTAITQTSLLAQPLRSDKAVCVPLVDSSEVLQRTWLDQVVTAADAEQMPLVIWHPVRDLLDAEVIGSCPCSGDVAICDHLGQLGAAADELRVFAAGGIQTVDGTDRGAAAVWRQAVTPD